MYNEIEQSEVKKYDIQINLVLFFQFFIKRQEVWKNKVQNKIGTTKAYFANLDDLIKMKMAAGRPKDKEDLEVLLKLKEKIKHS